MNRLFILLAAALLVAGCTGETPDAGTPVTIGTTEMLTKEGVSPATTQWKWQNGDLLTATANGLTSTYTYSASGWGKGNNSRFTKEAIGTASISLSFGNSNLIADQQTEANYRLADYITGSGTLDFLTINATLTHQYTDLVVAFSKGKGWENDTQFNNAISGASFQFSLKEGKNCAAYHSSADKKLFRAIISPTLLSTGKPVKLGTLKFGSDANTPVVLQNRTAQVSYNNNYTEDQLKSARMTVNIALNMDCSISVTISISKPDNLWEEIIVNNPFPAN